MKELKINSINWKQKCWKYFSVDRFIDAIENGYLYFAAANQFEDNFEGATTIVSSKVKEFEFGPNFALANNAFKELQRLTKISCWHKSIHESYAMWKIYAQENKGVAITTTPDKMRLAFKPYRIKSEYCEEDLIIGNVEYVDLTSQHIDDTMLDVFFYKHLIYAYENEIRLVISLRTAEEFGVSVPDEGVFVHVDYHELIEDIVLGPNLRSEDRISILRVCKKIGLDSKVQDSCLTFKPIFF
jgi:hypothetical protein